MKIKWTNKWSGETGYVKVVYNKEQYFENTFNADEAKTFSVRIIRKIIGHLEQFCSDNTYTAVAD